METALKNAIADLNAYARANKDTVKIIVRDDNILVVNKNEVEPTFTEHVNVDVNSDDPAPEPVV